MSALHLRFVVCIRNILHYLYIPSKVEDDVHVHWPTSDDYHLGTLEVAEVTHYADRPLENHLQLTYQHLFCGLIMFYEGDLQSGLALAVKESKVVVCFVEGSHPQLHIAGRTEH